jgi:parallel beta-helix repeat protein
MKRLITGTALVLLAACGSKAPNGEKFDLQTKLLDAKPGDVITIPAGKFSFDRSLSLNVDGVTIRGAGMDKTILSFKGQKAGAEGLLVNASNFTIEDLAIEDSKGDALKINEGENVIIRRVRTEWTGGPSTSNGAYGLYPVRIKNVLIEDSVAIAAADAGIYVGQSDNIVVRRNKASKNVAGIEIENSQHADVYDNLADGNTGGILVFNMPQLTKVGGFTRVFRNKVTNNNEPNFGAKGSAVSSVPAGSGVVINSNDDVEIFDNDISGNVTSGVIVSSYFSSGFENKYVRAETFDPWPEGIYVHNNRFTDNGGSPDGIQLKALRVAVAGLTGSLPPILWDGFRNPKATRPTLCTDGVAVLNADMPNKSKNPRIETAPFTCTLPPLAPVVLTGPLAEAAKP